MRKREKFTSKPVELYYFIDPINPECWSLEPILKKLTLEYGGYFSIVRVLTSRLSHLNLSSQRSSHLALWQRWEEVALQSGMSCDGTLWLENPILEPYKISIAIKAATMQNRRAGAEFLRKIQEALFIEKKDVTLPKNLLAIAKELNLDESEFLKDLASDATAKAFQNDLDISAEMFVEETPAFVFFNNQPEDEGLKITGVYSYGVYEQILQECLGTPLNKAELPTILDFLKRYDLVASQEISVIYQMDVTQVNKRMHELLLAQKVEKITAKHGYFWRLKRL